MEVIVINGIFAVDSRDVAKMIDTEHSNLLKKIENINKDLNEVNFNLVNLWSESVYLDKKGETRKCYQITKQGCEFIANKYTGKKGNIFTALYVEKFNEMENQKPKTLQERTQALLIELDQENKDLRIRLDVELEYASVKKVERNSQKKFDWQELKKYSKEHGYEIKKVEDRNYSQVNAYHKDVWLKVYNQDITLCD